MEAAGGRWSAGAQRSPEPGGGRPLPGGRRPPATEREAASFERPDPVEAGVLEEAAGCREGGGVLREARSGENWPLAVDLG